jgi:hypothetical protein
MNTTTSTLLSQALQFAHAARVVQIAFPHDDLVYQDADVTSSSVDGEDDNEVLHLYWGAIGNETSFDEGGILRGAWTHDAFLCFNTDGEACLIRFVVNQERAEYLQPERKLLVDDGFGRYGTLLQEALWAYVTAARPDGELAVDLLAHLEQNKPERLLEAIFPDQYRALVGLQQINVIARAQDGYDWNTLSPALNTVNDVLGLPLA